MAARRVVILRFSSAGDVVLTSPAIDALHRAWPQTEIVYAIKRGFAPLVENDPRVHHVVALESGEGVVSFARRLRELECDAVLDLHGKIRSRLLRPLLKIPRQVVWHKRDASENLPVRLGLKTYQAGSLIAQRYHRAVEQLVGRPLPPGELSYHIGAEQQRTADELLKEHGVTGSVIGLSPGAAWQTKRWPVERFAALAQRVRDGGHSVVITGSPGERDLGAAIASAVDGVTDLCGRLEVGTLGGIINRCMAFVANDSGPMHIARALGVPTVSIFGSTDPGQFDFEGHQLVYVAVSCAPCHFYGRSRCPRFHFRCMNDIDVDTVHDALGGALETAPLRAPAVRG